MHENENMIEVKIVMGLVVVGYLLGVRRGRGLTLRSLGAIRDALTEKG